MDQFLLPLFSQIPFLSAFLAGILSFLSPCVLPLVPAYLSYISNQSLHSLKQATPASCFFILPQALLFVFGFSLIFMIFGASMAKILHLIPPSWLKILSGVVILLFGLHFLGVLHLKFLYQIKSLHLPAQKRFHQIFTPFLLGVSFALGWTPCIGPIFSSIILLSSYDKSHGMILMLIFTSGLALPFILCALAFSRALATIQFFKHHARKVEILSGVLLIALSLAILGGWLDALGSL